MSNVFDDTRAAVKAAEAQLKAADKSAYDMADLLRGRLRHVRDGGWSGADLLRDLKRELQSFNSVTGKWKP